MKREPLNVVIQRVPSEDFAERRSDTLDLLADAFADVLIAKARAELARALGRNPDDLDHEKGRTLADELEELAEVQLRAPRRASARRA